MSIRVSVLSSGSRGNATFIRTDTVRMLIDCGLGPRTLANRLRAIGQDPDQIDVVMITHEHSDHVAGLKSMVEKYSLDVFMYALVDYRIEPEEPTRTIRNHGGFWCR